MATLIQDSVIHHDTVVINDIDIHTNEKTTSTLDLNSQSDNSALPKNPAKTAQLKMVDDLFGPIEIGSLSVTRVSLDILGATIDGQSLNGRNTFSAHRSALSSTRYSSTRPMSNCRCGNRRVQTVIYYRRCYSKLPADVH